MSTLELLAFLSELSNKTWLEEQKEPCKVTRQAVAVD